MIDEALAHLRSRLRAKKWTAAWNLPSWQAHRGYHKSEKENSLGSLRAAARQGAEMCEFDVRLTKDQVPVLFHDVDLKRLTGRSGLLSEVTCAELATFSEVPTLQQVLTDSQVPHRFNIEIKSEQIWNDPLERRVAEVIKQTKSQDRVLFSSFNPLSLWKLQTLLPESPRALLVAKDLENRWLREMAFAPFLSLHGLNLQDQMLPDEKSVRAWKRQGFLVSVWTVNEQDQIRRYLEWGVDSIITDLIPTTTS